MADRARFLVLICGDTDSNAALIPSGVVSLAIPHLRIMPATDRAVYAPTRKPEKIQLIPGAINFADEFVGFFHLAIQTPAKGTATPFVKKLTLTRPLNRVICADPRKIGGHLSLAKDRFELRFVICECWSSQGIL